jgi:diguanylate cyclase (GGDEF)-like protein/PAS domain S-box-containing protein
MRNDLSWNEAHRVHRQRGRRAMVAAVAAVVVGIVLSAALSVAWASIRREGARSVFRTFAAEQPLALAAASDRYVHTLAVLRGFFESSNEVTERDWETFAASLRLEEELPALRSIEFIEQTGDGTYPVRMVAPSTAAPGLLGADRGRDADVRATLHMAVGNGGVTVAPPTLDVWQRPRVLMVTPVMEGADVVGWIGGTIDPIAFGREVLEGLPAGINGSLAWDGGEPFVTLGPGGTPVPGLSAERTLEMEEAMWTLRFEATSSFMSADRSFPWWVLLGGLVPALVGATVLYGFGRSRMRALLLAERLGRDLAVSEARARAVTEAAVEAIVTTDATGTIESANPATEALFGWPAAQLVGRGIGLVVPSLEPSDDEGGPATWDAGEQLLDGRRRDGTVLHIDVSIAPTSVEDRPLFVVIARDATLRKLREDQLTHQATHDALTGLSNRQLFGELLARAAHRADRSRAITAVLFLDLDGFKDVNDLFGHQAGDRVLAETARRLEATVRPGDVVARLGGDEFAVLCEDLASPDDAETIARRILEVLPGPIPVAGGVAQVSGSVGVAVGRSGEAGRSILERADRSMYDAKRAGKAGYAVSVPVG